MDQISLIFGQPEHGWLDVGLRGPNGESRVDASDVPGDSLHMLAEAACALLEGSALETVDWFLEPAEVQWQFRSDGVRVEVVTSGRDHKRSIGTFPIRVVTSEIARALRALESKWKPEAWSNPFPNTPMAKLHRLLHA